MSVQDRSERALGSFAFQPATSYEHVGGGIVEVDMDGRIVLPNDTAMPLTLIVNELVTNVVRRGIRSRISDKVRISLTESGGQLLLSIEDGGDGFDLAAVRRSYSGRQLVSGLARQLQDSFEVTRNPSMAGLRFPASGI